MSAVQPELRDVLRLMRGGEWSAALRRVDEALIQQPLEPRYLVYRAQCLMALRRTSEALAAAAAAEQHAPADAFVRDAAATVYSYANDHARALASYDAALAQEPDNAQLRYNRASVRRFLGDLAGAEQDYDRTVASRPTDYEAYKHRSDLRTQTAQNNHVRQLYALLARPIPDWRGEVQLRYALAKEYEDLGQYAESFQMLQSAAHKQRQNMRYDVAADLATVRWIIDAFPDGAGSAVAGACEEAPVFVLGLPRSGTTLVERILGSHSAVTAAGELDCFALALVAAVQGAAPGVRLSRQQLVAGAARVDFAALGRDYLRRVRLQVEARGRFVDKMPLNHLYCGMIRRALPNAKIVHVTRHPMAACYAMYKAWFKNAYPFSYELGEIAQYYVGYRRLMQHWATHMPGAIHSISYEALVADQDRETRKLLQFCGLEWQDACARFHDNPAASTTASAAQVRRPIYASSVDQWRHYEAQLAGLRARLAAAGVEL